LNVLGIICLISLLSSCSAIKKYFTVTKIKRVYVYQEIECEETIMREFIDFDMTKNLDDPKNIEILLQNLKEYKKYTSELYTEIRCYRKYKKETKNSKNNKNK
jgi:hypothetical protein